MSAVNFLIVQADQLNAFSLGAYGNGVVQSPNADTLAANGVVFDAAYCNSPLCAPSRFSMMAGQLPSRIAAYDNAAYFPANVPTLAHYLRAMGYLTCLSGKMHFVGPDQLHGFEERLTTDIYPADFGWTPDWERSDERIDWWYHNLLSVKQAGVAEITNQLEYDDEVGAQALARIYDLARGGDERPFCLFASFTHPHDPYATRKRYWDLYDPADIDMPHVPTIPYDDLDPHSQRLHDVSDMGRFEISDDDIRNARRAYYGNVSYIDEWLGKLLGALRDTGLADNTVVLLLSDHGDMLGERGLWYKMSWFEHSARIPLIVSAPHLFDAKRVAPPASLVDLLPTLVEIAAESGSESPPETIDGLGGASLVPSMAGSGDDEGEVIGEYLGEGAIAPLLMIRRGLYKYVHSQPDPPQLYNLDTDPSELTNLSGEADVADIEAAFAAEVGERWDEEDLKREVIADQARRRLLHQALGAGQVTPWDYQPSRDASQRFMRNTKDLNELEASSRFPPLE